MMIGCDKPSVITEALTTKDVKKFGKRTVLFNESYFGDNYSLSDIRKIKLFEQKLFAKYGCKVKGEGTWFN